MNMQFPAQKAYEFDADEEFLLRDHLADVEKNTIIYPVVSPIDCILGDDFKTKRGYTYSSLAFRQACKMLCSGLMTTLPELAGMHRTSEDSPDNYSSSLAVDIFNRVIKLRFSAQLQAAQLILDNRNKTIDGVVGIRYRHMSNHDFYSLTKETINSRPNGKFVWAVLSGRSLYMRYRWQEPTIYTDYPADTYGFGLQLHNTETGGSSARSAVTLIRNLTGEYSLDRRIDMSGHRFIHTGADFHKHIRTFFSSISNRLNFEVIQPRYESKLRKLQKTPFDPENRKTQLLRGVTTQRRISGGFAKRVINSAMLYGSSTKKELTPEFSHDQVIDQSEAYTAYDIFVAVIREATKLPLYTREQAQQIAHAILTEAVALT